MALSDKLNRTLRATEEGSDSDAYAEGLEGSSPSVLETGEGGDIASSDSEAPSDEEENEGEDDLSEEADEDDFQNQMSKVSFGALAKAQESLEKQDGASRKRKRGSDTTNQQEDKLQALRERLRELRAEKEGKGGKASKKAKIATGKPREDDSDGDSDDDSSSDRPSHARSSKHAPAVQSSKRAVTRRRNVVEVKKPVVRDPRFDTVAGPQPSDETLKKRYAFLNDYKASEMAELKAAIKKTKNEEEREKLKRKLLSMESQQKSQAAKDKQQEILREHRKKEKDLVKQGKQPFYLKKSEQKKLALVDRFQNMKGKQRDKVIERRRKKTAAKERKNMPMERRV